MLESYYAQVYLEEQYIKLLEMEKEKKREVATLKCYGNQCKAKFNQLKDDVARIGELEENTKVHKIQIMEVTKFNVCLWWRLVNVEVVGINE